MLVELKKYVMVIHKLFIRVLAISTITSCLILVQSAIIHLFSDSRDLRFNPRSYLPLTCSRRLAKQLQLFGKATVFFRIRFSYLVVTEIS